MAFKLRPITRLLLLLVALVLPAHGQAQDSDEEEYKPELPEVSIYKAMLDANKQTGWVQFRNFGNKQLIYFTALQVMHCRVSEIRYSVNGDALDKRFPVGACDPQLPFNLPSDDTNEYVYISLAAKEAQTITVQVVWDDGAGSEIIVYKPCDDVGDASCARIKTIKKPAKPLNEPGISDSPIRSTQTAPRGKTFSEPTPSSAARP
ncbi:hypothetical protein [Pararhizobium antarcticum]|uniref:Uncharacterized protein n=1 Tax=Pararhizobium antarcticum TaxID=1798805 RepID=A0A657LUA2_9HYPH|nr:hypothetical protein [Pararhizobium antarcticum]OJF98428.1 hypothetical protein AX760_14365 [Pararhizobium antarcticum]OJG01055.1 hypothetical protein AX761_00045 [Rhizobium sp. 58]